MHVGEGNGNPLQCSCLENPRDRGAWRAAIYGVTQCRTRLKWLGRSSSSMAEKSPVNSSWKWRENPSPPRLVQFILTHVCLVQKAPGCGHHKPALPQRFQRSREKSHSSTCFRKPGVLSLPHAPSDPAVYPVPTPTAPQCFHCSKPPAAPAWLLSPLNSSLSFYPSLPMSHPQHSSCKSVPFTLLLILSFHKYL